jgi:hypothetical protein
MNTNKVTAYDKDFNTVSVRNIPKKLAVYIADDLPINGKPRQVYDRRALNKLQKRVSPITRRPIVLGIRQLYNETPRQKLLKFMETRKKLTKKQIGNYLNRLKRGESANRIMNDIKATTITKTNTLNENKIRVETVAREIENIARNTGYYKHSNRYDVRMPKAFKRRMLSELVRKEKLRGTPPENGFGGYGSTRLVREVYEWLNFANRDFKALKKHGYKKVYADKNRIIEKFLARLNAGNYNTLKGLGGYRPYLMQRVRDEAWGRSNNKKYRYEFNKSELNDNLNQYLEANREQVREELLGRFEPYVNNNNDKRKLVNTANLNTTLRNKIDIMAGYMKKKGVKVPTNVLRVPY